METQNNKTRKIKMFIIIAIVLFGIVFTIVKTKRISPLGLGMHNPINQPMFSKEAINGYDPVAYFKEQRAVKGDTANTFEWKGATWYFSSQENLNSFKVNPEMYVPQFGGYCAFAVSKGFTANSDPNAWKIIDNKLYLYSEPDFLEKWMANFEENLQKSNLNWK